jgi:hypothetical protein
MTDAAAIYARQSHGKERSIAEQVSEGERDCAGEGWPVAGVYRDTTSASRFARAGRPRLGPAPRRPRTPRVMRQK